LNLSLGVNGSKPCILQFLAFDGCLALSAASQCHNSELWVLRPLDSGDFVELFSHLLALAPGAGSPGILSVFCATSQACSTHDKTTGRQRQINRSLCWGLILQHQGISAQERSFPDLPDMIENQPAYITRKGLGLYVHRLQHDFQFHQSWALDKDHLQALHKGQYKSQIKTNHMSCITILSVNSKLFAESSGVVGTFILLTSEDCYSKV
jgi:hypothetical protein